MKNLSTVLRMVICLGVFTATQSLALKSSLLTREVAARNLPVPTTVSLEEQEVIAAPLQRIGREIPQSAAAWKAKAAIVRDDRLAKLPELRKQLGVTIKPTTIGGVKAFILRPKIIAEGNKNRLLVNVHGGAYLFGSGESGTSEATMLAAYCQCKVIAIDYRTTPDFPFPAAIDDAMAVWKAVVKTTNPHNIAIVGCSAGGALVLAMVQRAQQEGLPLPAAIAPGTPWADLSKTGDSYFTNDGVDNVIGSYDGFIAAAAKLYANGRDLKDSALSPIYGNFQGFPPTLLTSRTRDLLLSDTVRVHRKLRAARVDTQLQIFEGQSHGQYMAVATAPETKEYFAELTHFFNLHLGN
jgi:monoterpene epsilon-lactone hydrolase